MSFFVRFRLATLALMLTVSHVALISHVTAHFEPELETCELCVSQAQPIAAIPSADHPVQTASGIEEFWPAATHRPPFTSPGSSFHPRAPPIQSS
jgi:hypothetical protein